MLVNSICVDFFTKYSDLLNHLGDFCSHFWRRVKAPIFLLFRSTVSSGCWREPPWSQSAPRWSASVGLSHARGWRAVRRDHPHPVTWCEHPTVLTTPGQRANLALKVTSAGPYCCLLIGQNTLLWLRDWVGPTVYAWFSEINGQMDGWMEGQREQKPQWEKQCPQVKVLKALNQQLQWLLRSHGPAFKSQLFS